MLYSLYETTKATFKITLSIPFARLSFVRVTPFQGYRKKLIFSGTLIFRSLHFDTTTES
jgi:hypothetical protein